MEHKRVTGWIYGMFQIWLKDYVLNKKHVRQQPEVVDTSDTELKATYTMHIS